MNNYELEREKEIAYEEEKFRRAPQKWRLEGTEINKIRD